MPRTLDEIRRQGLEVLRRELGRAGLVRFLQQFSTGQGDYTELRRDWVDRTSLEELRALSSPARSSKQGKRAREKEGSG
jgi:hypothetical protein